MTDSERLEFIMRVLRTTAFENCDDIWWRTDDEYAPLTLFVNCSDVFCWGTADAEEVTPENVAIMEQAYADCRAADPRSGYIYGSMLFCARVRGMRPQGAAYPGEDHKALWPLFDACGPERTIEMGNPRPQPKSSG